MHINTMVCKGNMNFAWGEKKWRETTGVVPATMPVRFRGRAPGKSALLYHSSRRSQQKDCGFLDFRTAANLGRRDVAIIAWPSLLSHRHLAATELTLMVSPSRVPVTVAFLPACLSSVARAALSVVSRI